MIHQPLLALLAVGCVVAAVVWGRSTLRLHRAWRRTIAGIAAMEAAAAGAAATAGAAEKAEMTQGERAAADLARSAFRKELHTTIFYGIVATAAFVCSFSEETVWNVPFLLMVVPMGITFRYGGRFLAEAH